MAEKVSEKLDKWAHDTMYSTGHRVVNSFLRTLSNTAVSSTEQSMRFYNDKKKKISQNRFLLPLTSLRYLGFAGIEYCTAGMLQ